MSGAKKKLGGQGEAAAARYLEKQGYRIEARNFRCRAGEIDLVATKEGYLVFVEVKTRTAGGSLNPSLSVTRAKQAKVRQVGEVFCSSHPWMVQQPRFDVIAVSMDGRLEEVEHLIDAF
ncbi:MAG: YraN family protein [bacterium]